MESSVHPSVDFFLGATTPAGFKGYFAPLRREPGMQLVLLKSGPGCGKSTLMKRLARAAQDKGEPIQRIHCASDSPDFSVTMAITSIRTVMHLILLIR